jgi:hypothetical protein
LKGFSPQTLKKEKEEKKWIFVDYLDPAVEWTRAGGRL